ncbi:restriction endonuclease subunit S [Nostoc sp.]|uniref:restriction endonuclease subunit S n=1 Tax=Nostoc sp. TaxID=1180 RepID=UPI002FF7E757
MLSKPVWQEEKLGKYAYIKGRIGWRGLKASEYTHDGAYLIAGNHIIAGQVNWSDCDHISMRRYLESREIALEEGDIILTKDGTIGRVAIIDKLPGLATINSTMMLIRVRSPLVPRYVYHYLTGDNFQKLVADKVSGSSIPHIFQRDMVELTIPVPSESEQHYIAEILDSIDSAIAHTSSLIAKLKHIKAGLLNDLLTRGLDKNGEFRDAIAHPEQFQDSPLGRIPKDWEITILSQEIEILHGYAFKGEYFADSPPGEVLLVPGNFHREGGLYFDKNNIKYYQGTIPNSTFLKNGDLLTVMTDLSPKTLILGRVVLLDLPFKVLHNQRIGKIVLKSPNLWNKEFLMLVMNSNRVRENIISNATGTTVRHTSPERITRNIVAKPKIQEQKKIADIIDAQNIHIRAEEDYLNKLKLQKKGLMDDLLTGRVRVDTSQKITA